MIVVVSGGMGFDIPWHVAGVCSRRCRRRLNRQPLAARTHQVQKSSCRPSFPWQRPTEGKRRDSDPDPNLQQKSRGLRELVLRRCR